MAEKLCKDVVHKVKVLDENGKPKKDEKGKFIWEEVATTYRIDADFVPPAIDEICEDFIINYCKANNQMEWLDTTVHKKEARKNKKDETIKEDFISFVSLRSAFVKEFFPSIIKGKPKKLTLRERIEKGLV